MFRSRRRPTGGRNPPRADETAEDIANKAASRLPCYANNQYVARSLKRQPTSNSFIIEEKSTLTNSTISICYTFICNEILSESDFHKFLSILYQDVAPLVSDNFRAVNPVIIARGYEPLILDYIVSYNSLSIRRPILAFQW